MTKKTYQPGTTYYDVKLPEQSNNPYLYQWICKENEKGETVFVRADSTIHVVHPEVSLEMFGGRLRTKEEVEAMLKEFKSNKTPE